MRALQCKPLVSRDNRGSREEVVNEVTGLLVPLKDVGALTAAIRRMVEAPNWAGGLGRAGRNRALEFYDEKKVLKLQIDRVKQ